MKKNTFKFLSFCVLASLITACGGNKDSQVSSNDSSISSQESTTNSVESSISSVEISSLESSMISSLESSEAQIEVIENEMYKWPFVEGGAYSGNMFFSASGTDDSKGNLSMKINDGLVTKEAKVNFDATITYDIDPNYPVHSDTVEHCFNEIIINGESLGSLPSDNSKGVAIANDLLCEGTNVFSITIGETYNHKAWNKDLYRGGLREGWGDDFRIANVSLKLISGEVIKPTKMRLYKPADLKTGSYNTYDVEQPEDEFYWLGDGWGTKEEGHLSIDKSPNARLDIPFQIDYFFEYETPWAISTYDLDTREYKDGKYTVSLYDCDDLVLQNNIFIDNGSPEVKTNMDGLDYVNNDFKLQCSISDAFTGIKESEIKIDGKVLDKNSIYLSYLKPGKHNIIINATDKANNKTIYTHNFVIMANADVIDVSSEDNKLNISSRYDETLRLNVLQANELSYNTLHPFNTKQESSTEVPYDEFTISVDDVEKDIYLSYEGTTKYGERIVVEALNPTTNAYERITLAKANAKINFKINPKNYVSSGQMKIKISPFYVGNGSNRMLWSSDTQYLPKTAFTDINYMYNGLMNYIVGEYKDNKMAYLVHTGDVVDDHPGYGQSAVDEWENATKAFKILDDAKVPYGVSAGNHDVGTSLLSLNYVHFSNYMSVDRFKDSDVYAGSLNSNECHYDLVTVGAYDFVVLYLGFGVEAKDETIKWANDVLKTFRHRNAIVATHAYLTEKGVLDPNSQAQQIYDYIVVPNENVKFVFCGHTDGNAIVKKQITDDRYVYELLNCYQFVETGKYSVSHVINGYKCNGEAFIKELIFENNVVTGNTFSPFVSSTTPYGSKYGFSDKFTLNVDLYSPCRELTSTSLKVYQSTGNVVLTNGEAGSVISLDSLDSNSKYIAFVDDYYDGYGFILL